ncbi:hypothetical protein DL765_004799 [Monosporascus sp. GIB2]|nr:hypothetical protein DL765_004799 [Monosporascus sp. GIB2]
MPQKHPPCKASPSIQDHDLNRRHPPFPTADLTIFDAVPSPSPPASSAATALFLFFAGEPPRAPTTRIAQLHHFDPDLEVVAPVLARVAAAPVEAAPLPVLGLVARVRGGLCGPCGGRSPCAGRRRPRQSHWARTPCERGARRLLRLLWLTGAAN